MSVEIRERNSPELKKHISIVKKMSVNMGFNENMKRINWKAVRFFSNLGYTFMPKEKGVKYRKINLANAKGILVIPNEIQNENDFILYIHGGGFVSGSAYASKGYSSMLAKYSGVKTIAIDYSLAPEHPYPYGLNDVYNAYLELLKRYPKAKISLVGESGGANLCLATTIRLIENSKKLPTCIIVHSPATDLKGMLKRKYEVNDFIVSKGGYKPLQEIYAPNYDLKNPEISPIYFDKFESFPPIYITCDYNEILRADAEELYKKCNEKGIDATLVMMKNAFHSFATIGSSSPETKQILEENCEFIKKHFLN